MKSNTKKLVTLAMLAAVSYIIVALFRVPVFPPPVDFLKLEIKDVVVAIGGFLYGPLSALLISAVVSLVEMITVSTTGPIGAVMNLLSTCSFACTAAFIYKHRRTLPGALVGLICGSVAMTVVMLLWNWLITPLYMGYPRAAVEAMLIPYFLPFNALKAGLNTALTMVLYKPIANTLRKTGLLEQRPHGTAPSKLGVYLFAGALLATCVIALLVLRGVL
jgi:riboflavin transporter FmnP